MEDPKNSTPQPEEDKKQPEDTTTPQPAPEVADIPPAMATGTMPKKSKKKWLIAAGIVAAVILLAGASAAAYYGVIQPRQPKYVVARALGNTLSKDQLKSARYEGDFTITDKKEDKTYKGTFTGATNGKDTELSARVGIDVTTLKVDVKTKGSNEAYLKMDGLNGLSQVLSSAGDDSLAESAAFVESVNGQWVEIDQNAIRNLSGTDASAESVSLSKEDAKKVESIYKEHIFLDVTKTYDNEKIHGADSRHYEVKINRDELRAFMKELKAANIKGLEITPSMEALVKEVERSKYPIELWINEETNIINQVATKADMDDATVAFRMALKDVNKPVTITVPSEAKSLLELLGDSWAKEMEAMAEEPADAETSVELQPYYN